MGQCHIPGKAAPAGSGPRSLLAQPPEQLRPPGETVQAKAVPLSAQSHVFRHHQLQRFLARSGRRAAAEGTSDHREQRGGGAEKALRGPQTASQPLVDTGPMLNTVPGAGCWVLGADRGPHPGRRGSHGGGNLVQQSFQSCWECSRSTLSSTAATDHTWTERLPRGWGDSGAGLSVSPTDLVCDCGHHTTGTEKDVPALGTEVARGPGPPWPSGLQQPFDLWVSLSEV